MLTAAEKALIVNAINADAQTLGFAALLAPGVTDNARVANLLNAPDPSAGKVDIDSISAIEAQSLVVADEFGMLTITQQNLWRTLISMGSLSVKDPNIRLQVQKVWGAGTATRSALIALVERNASYVESIIDRPYTITRQEVRGLF